MLHRAGQALSFPVLFSSGHPDGNVDWEVRSSDGALLDSGALIVPADAVSVVVTVPASANALASGELLATRDVSWSYSVAGVVINDEQRYAIEGRLPFGVSPDGVRSKLGVDRTDLPNSEISLVGAYYAFEEGIGTDVLASVSDPSTSLAVTNAIEALAALALLPTMTVRIAAKESSGTNQFQRGKIDWSSVQLSLESTVAAAYDKLIVGYDATALFGSLLILARPDVDPLTGASV